MIGLTRKFPVSEEIIRARKCCLCGHLLSVAPIGIIRPEKDQYRCGRCKQVKIPTFVRDHLFEDVAQYLSFPCSYDECDKRIPWGWVEEHERNCPQRTISCPRYHRCGARVRVDKLMDHFAEKHPANVLKEWTWTVNTRHDYLFLTQCDNEGFLVYVLDMAVTMLALQPATCDSFCLQLLPSAKKKRGSGEYYVSSDIIRYDERLHCYGCVRRKCHQPHHPFSENNKSEEMDLSFFSKKPKKELVKKVISSDGNVRYHIRVEIFGRNKENYKRSAEKEEEACNNKPCDINAQVVKRALKCGSCNSYMSDPIYTHPNGYSACHKCVEERRFIGQPLLGPTVGGYRNCTLEEMAKVARMPCRYYFRGCGFTSRFVEMSDHEKECSFQNHSYSREKGCA